MTTTLDALGRRARRAWRWLTGRAGLVPVEAAVAWILRQEVDGGLPAREGGATPCPTTTRLAIQPFRELGLDEAVFRWAAWLATYEGGAPASNDRVPPMAQRMSAEPIDRLLALLLTRQSRDGGVAESSRGCAVAWPWTAPRRSVLTTLVLLDVALRQVRAAFDVHTAAFPDAIDPADGRYQAARRWMATLPAEAVVVDAGCGKGRFLRGLRAEFPRATFIALDLALAMLARCPAGVSPCAGSLLRLPIADSSVDGALAVESLEHALMPRRAVDELCRIVRPGGSVLVIDKHRARQPLSHHDPWERWFTPAELQAWLGRHCDQVSVEAVSHGEGRPGSDLFLAATGQRQAKPK